jgi:CheY-like chemotaxis protein
MSQPPLVAIVNDDKAIIAMLVDLLADEGYAAFSCFSGAEAHEAIQRKKPDLVILDMQMEQLDSGLIVLELIRLDPTTEQIPVIMCSADGQFLREKKDQLQAHRCDVLEKPYTLSELLTLMAKWLDPPLTTRSATT